MPNEQSQKTGCVVHPDGGCPEWTDEDPTRETERSQTTEERAAAALADFPLPRQSATNQENYRRILDWLYSHHSVATLVVALGDMKP